MQAMECSGLDHADHLTVHRTLNHVFEHVRSYTTFIPSFWASWGFVIASDVIDPKALASPAIDERLAGRGLTGLRHYDGETHVHLFALPRDVRAALERETAGSW